MKLAYLIWRIYGKNVAVMSNLSLLAFSILRLWTGVVIHHRMNFLEARW